MPTRKERYKPGQVVPQTGVYKVVHQRHRTAHQSTLLRGTKFPACKKCGEKVRFETVTPVPYVAIASELGRPHLLLVEEEPAVLATLTWVLEGEGYEVSAAESYSKALGLLSARSYDAVISEIDLGNDGQGITLAKNAMHRSPAPVVILSVAEPDEGKLRKLLGLRVSYVVMKPIDLGDLKEALARNLLRRADVLAFGAG